VTIAATPTSSASTRTWTPEQQRAIDTTGHSLLVSAAAGSGKTAVLTERCAYLVCDAPEPCNVDELLVVTFTEAAAGEMRTRIRTALAARAAKDTTDERVAHQLASVERATIGTLHAFCGRLLRQHFHAAGLDPDFAILDGDAAGLLKRETARKLIAARFAANPSAGFNALLDGYLNGDDGALASAVLSIYETLTALPDPQAWLAESRQRLADAADFTRLVDCAFGRAFADDVTGAVASLEARIATAQQIVARAGDFPAYSNALVEAAQAARNWRATLATEGIDALSEEADFQPTKLPSVSNALPGKAIAKGAVDDVRSEMKEGTLRCSLRFTESQWRDGMAATLAPARELLALVEDFTDAYGAAKSRLRSLDFSDLERRALELLREAGDNGRPSIVARGCHRRYRHVLVDEYQDINELQEAILRLVSRECYGAAKGNLFCVGDVKQSIYRFRAAEPDLFLKRYNRFKDEQSSGGEVIDLNANFRSRAPLLDAINAVFDRLMTLDASGIDYIDGHQLRAGATFPEEVGFHGAPIELHLVPAKSQAAEGEETDTAEPERAEREAMFIAARIKKLMGDDGATRARVADKDRLRDVRFGDIAILLRTRKFKIEQYADVLRKSGIPVLAEGGSGFFSAMETLDMLSLLRLLDNLQQDLPLAAVLRSPLAGLANAEDSLARIRLAYPIETVAFHDAVQRYAVEHDDELAAHLRHVLNQLNAWRELAQRRPLAEVLATVYEQSGYLAFVCGLDDGPQRKANLLELHRRATQFGQLGAAGGGLSRFLAFLEELSDEFDAGQANVASAAVDAVRIVTVHKSKGLEFPIVFVADLGKAFNLSDARGPILYDKDEGLGLQVVDEPRLVRYPSLATTVIRPRLTKKMLAEELRVLYVALTRAKEHLILVGTPKADQYERWRSRWAGHDGPLATEDILGAATPLAWLVPVAVATHGAVIEVTDHTDPEAAPEPAPADDAFMRVAPFAALKPLDPPPPADVVATDVIARLSYSYPHARYTIAAAAQSVTARAHAPVADAPSANHGATATLALPQPRFASEATGPNAADIGTATHVVLENYDFTRDGPPVRAQVESLVSRKMMSPQMAKCVDVESIEWLLAGEVGQLLGDPTVSLHRELPIYFAANVDVSDAAPTDPRDRVMVRGRVDLLVRTPDGDVIVDYKTDRVTGQRLADRIEAYRLQMAAYAEALQRVTGRKPAVWLVFLSQRKVVKL
jgi:ATP-dependent helicase/nuclease subunit A